MKKRFSILLALLCVVLLVMAYPQIQWWPLAWVALVPLFFLLESKSYKACFSWSYLCGFLFFGGTLGWFVYVTSIGAVLLIAYLALYFAVFGLVFRFFSRLPLWARLLVLPSVWVVLEFIRAHLITGFGWVMLGHSQYTNHLLIQIADITGVYGVSFLVMLVNVLMFESIRLALHQREHTKSIYKAQIVVGTIILTALGYGVWTASNPPQWSTVSVGIVQPNIAQNLKWDPNLQETIVSKSIHLSQAFESAKPDIIIWPETSLPGVVSESKELFQSIKNAARAMAVPFLIGAVTDEKGKYYNSAYLISAQGKVAQRYDKIHLVPFGEYLLLRPMLGWIVDKIIPFEDFSFGTRYTKFEAGCPQKTFGVLICFEDTVSYVRRNFAKAGVGFFVNMTNDAWFLDTKAPYIHLQAAVFGCVENKRALVRAANTGFSGFIDPFGRIIASVHDRNGKQTFISGIAAAHVPLVKTLTFYTKYGDIFTLMCFFVILGAIATRRKYA